MIRIRRRHSATPLDELGGTADGALAIVVGDEPVHMTSRRATTALRYFLARSQAPGADRVPGSIALTSALRGEGVSYVTRSLGAVMAYDGDATVAIVDLNWTEAEPPGDGPTRRAKGRRSARPRPAPLTEAGDRPLTLVDAIENGVDLDDIVVATANPRLSLINPGSVAVARRSAVAGSRELEKVIGQITDRFDHVLLDLPPVLASSHAVTLARLADAFILVVRHGITTTNQVDSALEELESLETIGVILNRFQTRIPRTLRKLLDQ